MSSDERSDLHLLIAENGSWLLTFLGIIGACFSGITVYFLKSRCSHIKICFGCIDCIREPLPASMVEIEAPNNTIPKNPISLNNVEIVEG